MKFKRSAGILLHPTSLPSKYGIGDLGPEAYAFVNFLESAGQTLWQVLPLGPTGYGNSPYQSLSAFAGNPLLISPDILIEGGYLSHNDINDIPSFNLHRVEFTEVSHYKNSLLRKAFHHFQSKPVNDGKKEFKQFCSVNKDWLDDFALFIALKNHLGEIHWSKWENEVRHRNKTTLKQYRHQLNEEIECQKFVQFMFFSQWQALKRYANDKGVQLIGDLPIFVSYDSSDVWAHKKYFTVDSDGKITHVAGVPPDYFSSTGQRWGNPLYRWKEMEKDNYKWWKKRFIKLFEMVDIIRIDHFRGFDAYWKIPASSKTAETGRWVKGPGKKFFTTMKKYLADLPILAEDLGFITDTVSELRDHFNFPGMKIIQFAFGANGEKNFLPHNYTKNCVVYTGTHDNDTTRGFFDMAKAENSDIFPSAQRYLNTSNDDLCAALIRTAYASVANLVIIPMQDILNLRSEARMNFPGKSTGNWGWRFSWDQVPSDMAHTYKILAECYDRS